MCFILKDNNASGIACLRRDSNSRKKTIFTKVQKKIPSCHGTNVWHATLVPFCAVLFLFEIAAKKERRKKRIEEQDCSLH